jgi:mannosyltransferase OCH1-like enzyme
MCNKNIDKKTLTYSKNWKRLNPNISIRLCDNKLCEFFLLNEFSPLHRDIFNFIKHGPIKADFWRVCVLYKYGGIYSDIDNEPLVPLDEFIDPLVDFVTCSSFSKRFMFNPNLILCNKENPIIKKCIDWYVEKYINNYNREEGIYNYNNMKIQIIKEIKGKTHSNDHNVYKNRKIFNNRYKDWNSNTHAFDENASYKNRPTLETMSFCNIVNINKHYMKLK